ncbi:MAG: PDZ domain-containing protein [Ruminococcaceae bacterium]|nr:PDZ domain-containing protein [Oscillospiraceae bacterium]
MFKRLISLACVLLFLMSFASCAGLQGMDLSGIGGKADLPSVVERMLESYSYYGYELDDEALAKLIVLQYAEESGDKYAYYYNEEEYAELNASNSGETQGIGITVTENKEYNCIEIISVMPNSPAIKAGLKAGDLIIAVGIGEKAEKVSDIGYDIAMKKLQGSAGTLCEFTVVRDEKFGEAVEFSVLREKYITSSVMYAVSTQDPTVGIVKILEFDLTTPTQFETAMEELIGQGCKKFVYDVRNNPGGDLNSVSAVLSLFYNEGDIIIRTRYRDEGEDNMETRKCEPAEYSGAYAGCSIKKENIGKYRNYPAAILANGNTASAAELFTCGMKDYGLATVVGETTYGKGCMQSIMPLKTYGLPGAIKMTTAFYYPPLSDNYHGIGISPDKGYEVALSDTAGKVNVYSLLDENQSLDNQLAAAISALEK